MSSPGMPARQSPGPDGLINYEARFLAWFEALYARHTSALSFSEVRRALGALSDLYVHKRHKLPSGDVFDGRGKRAAFALYYAPLHFMLIAHITQSLGAKLSGTLVDIGCGTGVGGIAWAEAMGKVQALAGFDRNPWAASEATWNWQQFGQAGRAQRGDATPERLGRLGPGDGVVAAYLINELPENTRVALLTSFLAAHSRGASVLIVEPIAKTVADFWPPWQKAIEQAGGRSDIWRTAVRLTPELRLLDKATGLRHDVLKGRSLYLPGRGAL